MLEENDEVAEEAAQPNGRSQISRAAFDGLFVGDPPRTDYDRFSHVLLDVRTMRSMESENRQFSLRKAPAFDTAIFRRWLPVVLNDRMKALLPEVYRDITLYLPKDKVKNGDKVLRSELLSPPPEHGFVVVRRPQRFWIIDGLLAERSTRKRTGFGLLPKEAVAEEYRSLIIANNLGHVLNIPVDEQLSRLSPDEVFRLRQLYWEARRRVHTGEGITGDDWRAKFVKFENIHKKFVEFEETCRSDPNRSGESPFDKAFFERTFTECLDHWTLAERLGERAIEAAGLGEDHQTIQDSINAYEDWADLYSWVERGPTAELYGDLVEFESDNMPSVDEEDEFAIEVEARYGKQTKGPKKTRVGICIQRATAKTHYCSQYEADADRKFVDGFNQYLTERQLVNELDLPKNFGVSARDKWFGSAFGDKRVEQLMLPDDFPINPAIYLGVLVDLPEEDRRIPSATEIWLNHIDRLSKFVESANALIELAEFVKRGGKLTHSALVEKYSPKLIDWQDDFIKIFVDADTPDSPESVERARHYASAGPGRKLVCLFPPEDWVIWLDYRWALKDNFYFRRWMRLVNEYLEDAGLPDHVRVTLDNYGRHWQIAEEIWRYQPAAPLEKRFRRELREAEDMGEINLRPAIRKAFSGLPFIYQDGREDLYRLVATFLEVADELYDDFIAEVTHAFDGTARGVSFGLTGGAIQAGYRRGISVHDPQKQKALRLGLSELALKAGYYDKLKGLVEAVAWDPDLRASSDKIKGTIVSYLQSRGLSRPYANIAVELLSKVQGIFRGLGIKYDPHPHKIGYNVEEMWLGEEIRLLGRERLLRLDSAEMYAGRWISLEGDLLVPAN